MNRTPQTILITGASSGIGAALALAYAREGVRLILTARNVERLEKVAASCRARGAGVVTGMADVRERETLAAFIAHTDAVTPIDLAIANAGISSGFGSSFEENYHHADEVFAINLDGVRNTIHPLIPRMAARGHGHIAIMSSLAGIWALSSAPAYSASKAAVRYYGEALQGELKPYGIDISIICPGWIATPLTKKNAFPMPFMMSADAAARRIRRGLDRKKMRIAFPLRLYLPLCLLGCIPFSLRSALLAYMPKKRRKS